MDTKNLVRAFTLSALLGATAAFETGCAAYVGPGPAYRSQRGYYALPPPPRRREYQHHRHDYYDRSPRGGWR